MTPEEWADQLTMELYQDGSTSLVLVDKINAKAVAAIRAAIEAEREACARMLNQAVGMVGSIETNCVLNLFADKIRARSKITFENKITHTE